MRWGCPEEGCRGFLLTPETNKAPYISLSSLLLAGRSDLNYSSVSQISTPTPASPHRPYSWDATHMAKEAASLASRSHATASGVPQDHSKRWKGWIQMKLTRTASASYPQRRKASGQRGVGGQSVCTSVCVHVYPCLQADRQELWRSKACMPGCQLAG